tara:strand:+ start:440 stop:1345 length:906 start_codon:yes stop_codon:yes gene_type:complete
MNLATRSNKNYILSHGIQYVSCNTDSKKIYELHKTIENFLIKNKCAMFGFGVFSLHVLKKVRVSGQKYIIIPSWLNYINIIEQLKNIGQTFDTRAEIKLIKKNQYCLRLMKESTYVWGSDIYIQNNGKKKMHDYFWVDQFYMYYRKRHYFYQNHRGINEKTKKIVFSELKNRYIRVVNNGMRPTMLNLWNRIKRSLNMMEIYELIPIHVNTLGQISILTTYESLHKFIKRGNMTRYKNVICPISRKPLNEFEKIVINKKFHTPIFLSNLGHIYDPDSMKNYLGTLCLWEYVKDPLTRQYLC